jgi:RNA-binding motif X-linked protein 2
MSESSASSGPSIDPEDPMRDYLIAQRKEAKALKSKKPKSGKRKHKDETPEERRLRKEKKREKKARKALGKSEGMKGVEALLRTLKGGGDRRPSRSRSPERRNNRRSRSRSPDRDYRMRTKSRSRSRSAGQINQDNRSRYDPDLEQSRDDGRSRRRGYS